MKKALTIIGCMLIAASMTAQQKGEMSVGGTLGFSAGTNNSVSISKFEGEKTKIKDNRPSGSFDFAPTFGYFVIDNLELSAGLRYGIENVKSFDSEDHNVVYNNGLHEYTLGIGLNYFVKLTDRFFYTPGFFYELGGASGYSNTKMADKNTKVIRNGFLTGIDFELGKFEVKLNKNFGLTLNLLSLDYKYWTTSEKSEDIENLKITFNDNDLKFRLSSKIGLKYYF